MNPGKHLRVKADGHVDVVLTGQKEQGVAGSAKLAVLLDGINLIDLRLDCFGRHRRVKDQYVGAKVGTPSRVVFLRRLGDRQPQINRDKYKAADESARAAEAGSNRF